MRQLQGVVCNHSGTHRERPFTPPCIGEGPTPGLGSRIARTVPDCRFRVKSSTSARVTRLRASPVAAEPRSELPRGIILFPSSIAAAGPAIGFLIVTLGVVLLIVAVIFLLYINRGPK